MSISHYSVTMKYGCTQNVGDYSNIRPELEVTLSGDGDADEAKAVIDQVFCDICKRVHNIVDDELELHGKPVLYWTGLTYTLLAAEDFDFLAMVPANERLSELWGSLIAYGYRNFRYETMLSKLANDPKFASRLEHLETCSTSQLPVLEKFTFLKIRHPALGRMLILCSGNVATPYGSLEKNAVPLAHWYDFMADGKSEKCVIMPRSLFLAKMRELATNEGFTIFDCLDHDFAALPELPPEPQQAPEESDDTPFEEDDEDDIDEDEEDE